MSPLPRLVESRALILTERGENALCCMAVPERNATRLLRRFTENGKRCRDDLSGVASDYYVRALSYRNWTLGVFAQRQAWNSQDARFFLNTTRIGEHQTRPAIETKKIQVTDRVNQSQPFHCLHSCFQTKLRHCFPGAWMNRENYRKLFTDRFERLKNSSEDRRFVDIRRPV